MRSTEFRRAIRIGAASIVAFFIAVGCGGDDSAKSAAPAAGTERGPCYGNGTCNSGLTCLSEVCVAAGAGGAAADAGAGGNTSSGGSAGRGGSGGSGGTPPAGGASATGGAAGSSGELDAGPSDSGLPDSSPTDASSAGGCDPVLQTGCGVGERCTWAGTASSGHLVCAPDGTRSSGQTCSIATSDAGVGLDDCKAGLACVGGRCFTLCDADSAAACSAGSACAEYAGYYTGGAHRVGVCRPECDPLTQEIEGVPACGSANPASPNRGCYGLLNGPFLCAGVVAPNAVQGVSIQGPVYANSCAPGFAAVLTKSSADETPICSALCKPAPTSSSTPGNAKGAVGSGFTCPDRGATGATTECRYWWLLEDPTKPTFPDAHSNTLGYCIDYTQYTYDSDGDTVPDKQFPSCATLSPTAHHFDDTVSDAEFWGCMPLP
ncbi:MAG TPA: hypothetical protein VHE30_19990 [Polyangiaceae bacterium]|nr:hypothetical protein [Polyangiaceae bacterium]